MNPNPSKVNLLCAELCGWKLGQDGKWHWRDNNADFTGELIYTEPPNFFGSLDDCAKFEAKLSAIEELQQRRAYVSALMKIVGVSPDMSGKWYYIQDFALLTATATQRALAFIRAVVPEREKEIY